MEKARTIINFDIPYMSQFKRHRKFPFSKALSFIFLTAFCILWMLPFIVLIAGALRSSYDAIYYPAELIPPHSGPTFQNFDWLFNGIPDNDVQHHTHQSYEIGYWFMNSCFSAIGGTLLYLLVASLTAYVFVFVDFKFRNAIFAFLVMTLVVPGTATAVGNQSTVFALGLNKSILGLIIPGLGGVYGMYLIKTFFEGIPKDLVESARMDGCSDFSIFAKIIIPNGKTVLFVQGLFGFMGGWNDLVWPQMLYGIRDNKLWTLQVGMAYIINNSKTADLQGMAFASGCVCLAPVLVVYLIAQNKIIEGMASAGIKR